MIEIKKIESEFTSPDNVFDNYKKLIDLGAQLPAIEPKDKTPENEISDCQSRLWIKAECIEGCMLFYGDSEARITRGILALILRVVNNQPPETILKIDWGFLDTIGLRPHLSPSRAGGLKSILSRIKKLTLEHSSMNAKECAGT